MNLIFIWHIDRNIIEPAIRSCSRGIAGSVCGDHGRCVPSFGLETHPFYFLQYQQPDGTIMSVKPIVLIIIIILAAIVFAGCTQTVTPQQQADGKGPNPPPAETGATLQQTMDTAIIAAGIPGAVVEIETPRWTWTSAAGKASPITGEPAQPGMRFLIASVSKTFTSVSVQKLAEEGKLSLDDPISRWLTADLVKRIPNGDKITVRQLLDHTSGIADYNEDSINTEEYQNPDVPVPYQTGLEQGIKASPLFTPGTNFTYSNVNYILLTLIIDKAAGVPYEDYVTRNIFVPAGMDDTFIQETNHIPGPHMTASMPGANGTFIDFSNLYVQFDRGAGDIVSTTSDLNRFHRALREGRLIGKSSLAAMEKPTPQSGRTGYGLGYATEIIAPANLTVQGHTGGYPGSFTFWYYLPEKDTYVTFNVNSIGTSEANLKVIRAAILTCLKDQMAAGSQTTPTTTAVTMTVPFGPVPVASTDGVNLAYELELVPVDGKAPVVERVEVLDPSNGKVLYTEDGALLSSLYHPASVPPPTAAELQGGTGKVPLPRISIWFKVSPDAVPDKLVHRLTLNRTAAGLPPVTITGGEISIRKDQSPVVVGFPMHGTGWMVMETTSPMTHHFRAQITMNGVPRVPQRYAQDWVLLDPVTGQAAAGNATLARNYYGFGKEIYSVADGTVMDAGDGLPDSEGIYSPLGTTIPTAAGNYVILDLGNKKYACYAHLVNGSVRVKKGDTVKEGQVLGLMGNSGNSDIPHLHFQVVTNSPSFLGAEGYPHVYRSFDVTGEVNATEGAERMSSPGYSTNQLWSEFGSLVTFFRQPVMQENRLPENNVVVRFP
jgi:D-alanyl-D-alanine carboxypeptidase